jgi:hypothetical protein
MMQTKKPNSKNIEEQLRFEMGYLIEECERLRTLLAERESTIRLLVKAATTLEGELADRKNAAQEDVPF